MRHGMLTFWAPIAPGREADLRGCLATFDPGTLGQALEDLHLAAAVIIKEPEARLHEEPAVPLAPHLVFEANFDGPRELFVARLVDRVPAFVDQILGCCEGYPPSGTAVPPLVRHYLLSRDQGADCAFVAFPNHSAPRILQECRLRDVLAGAVADIPPADMANGTFAPPLRTSLYVHLRRLVFENSALQPLLTLPARMIPTRGFSIFRRLMRVMFVLLLLAFIGRAYREWHKVGEFLTPQVLLLLFAVLRAFAGARPFIRRLAWLLAAIAVVKWLHDNVQWLKPYIDWLAEGLNWMSCIVFPILLGLIALVIAWLVVIQLKEALDEPDPTLPSFHLAREATLRARENRGPQNHLGGFNLIKPGWFRLLTLRCVLAGVHYLKQIENKGDLSGIETIHFARWTIIKAARRHWLLFLTNYDGDWDAYLGDFVSEASSGVTAIWSNCVGFPRAWFLFRGGSRDERLFKAYARKSQFETLFRFSAYPGVTVSDIANHAAVRETLGAEPDPAAIDAFLRRL